MAEDGRNRRSSERRSQRNRDYYAGVPSSESRSGYRQTTSDRNRSGRTRRQSDAASLQGSRSSRYTPDARSQDPRSYRQQTGDSRQAGRTSRRDSHAHRESSRYSPSSSGDSAKRRGQSRNEPEKTTFSLPGGFSPHLIVLAVAALALLVIIGVAVSNCSGCSKTASSRAASPTSARAADASSASSTTAAESQPSASADAASTTAAPESGQSPTQATPAQQAHVNAQQGDVSYIVSQAAQLKHRDADFAVDPTRTTWNYDTPNGHKTMYLTFDDGPSSNTERVLDILDQYNCKATFFVTGQNPDYFSWIKEAYDRGHTIGLHSYSHDYESCYSSAEGFWNEFDAIGQVVKDQIGYVPCFIRFPGGASNTISAQYASGIMSQLAEDVHARGYQYYDWSLSCGDGSVHTADELIDSGCIPPDEENVIYLLHDGAAKESTAEALPAIIEYYQGLGYSFEALDRNSLVYQHNIAN